MWEGGGEEVRGEREGVERDKVERKITMCAGAT